VGLAGAFADLVFTTVVGAFSEDEGRTLAPKIMGASWTMSYLISEVTKRALGAEMEAKSCAMITSSIGLAARVPPTRSLTELSSAPGFTIKSVV